MKRVNIAVAIAVCVGFSSCIRDSNKVGLKNANVVKNSMAKCLYDTALTGLDTSRMPTLGTIDKNDAASAVKAANGGMTEGFRLVIVRGRSEPNLILQKKIVFPDRLADKELKKLSSLQKRTAIDFGEVYMNMMLAHQNGIHKARQDFQTKRSKIVFKKHGAYVAKHMNPVKDINSKQ
jgi:hypothetical protein